MFGSPLFPAIASALESKTAIASGMSPVPGAVIDPKELLEFLIPRLPHFMVPRYVRIVDTLPKTVTQGALVAEVDTIAIVEAMKMEIPVVATAAGKIAESAWLKAM